MPVRRLLALVLLSAFSCATTSGSPPGSPGPGTGVPEVLDFSGPLLDGGTFEGADLAGEDVAFWFWAPW